MIHVDNDCDCEQYNTIAMEMVPETTLVGDVDVEMTSLRRSTRVVSKPKRINYEHSVKSKGKSKTKSKTKAKTQVNTKSRSNAKTSRKRMKTFIDKFADLRKTKVSDMFCLVKKYAVNEQDRQDKYTVLQTVLKGMKDNDIKNSLIDMYTHKHRLVGYIVTKLLSTPSPMCFTRVLQHIEDMLSYKEVDGIECVNASNASNASNDMMDTATDETTHQSALQDGIDALDELQSIFRRLLV
jgi:hypothetical protein